MKQADIHKTCPPHLRSTMMALCDVSAKLSIRIARGALEENLGKAVGDNIGGDEQKALDIIADDAYSAALAAAGLRYYASEEQDDVVTLDPTGTLALAIDPLDGSSNIDVNVSIGTIFSIFPAGEDGNSSFLRPASEQIAAGYFIYGPQTVLLVTYGKGVLAYTLDPKTSEFTCTQDSLALPEDSSEFAINASNYRHWPKPIRAYIDDCLAGIDGPRSKNFNMRWVASLVAETHRIISRGGVFLYPGDQRNGYAQGRLRHVYECAPIAMLVEQAGGKATDGIERILDLTPSTLHARTPFIFGTPTKVDRVRTYFDLPHEEISALFGSRGLFRA